MICFGYDTAAERTIIHGSYHPFSKKVPMYPTTALDKPAITMYPSGRSLTHRELHDQAAQFANALQAIGSPDAGGVAFLLAKQTEVPVGLLGARLAGFDHLLLNTHASPPEQVAIINQLGPQVLVVSDTFAELAEKLRPLLDPHIRFVMVGEARTGWESFDRLLAAQPTIPPEVERLGRLLLLSGGSTGVPKIVVRPQAREASAARTGGALAELPHVDENSVLLLSAPLYYTMTLGWLVGGIEIGTHIVILDRWHPERFLEAVERFSVTHLPLVPTMMVQLLGLPQETRDKYEVSSIRAVLHSAAPCAPHIKEAFMAWIGPLYESYGSTEGFGRTQIGPDEWRSHRGSVGRATRGRIVIRDEDGRELPPGKIGIICFARDDGARMHYFGDPEATEAAYNQYGEGTALDIGWVDEDGYLYVVGRQKRMVIMGGINIYPELIEEALLDHESVYDVGVVGVFDHNFGEVPIALIKLQDGWEGSDELVRELRGWCYDRINAKWHLARVVFVDSIPRLETGKLDVRALNALVV